MPMSQQHLVSTIEGKGGIIQKVVVITGKEENSWALFVRQLLCVLILVLRFSVVAVMPPPLGVVLTGSNMKLYLCESE